MSKKPVKKAVKKVKKMKNAEYVWKVAETHLLSNVIHDLLGIFNPEIVKDLDCPPEEIANAKRWWKDVKPITDELFEGYLKLEVLVKKMRRDER